MNINAVIACEIFIGNMCYYHNYAFCLWGGGEEGGASMQKTHCQQIFQGMFFFTNLAPPRVYFC